MIGLLIGFLAAGAALRAAVPQPAVRNACELLTAHDIRSVQTATLKERKASEQQRKGLRFAHCFFTTTEFVSSISLTAITTSIAGGSAHQVRTYWDDTFRERKEESEEKSGSASSASREEEPPRAIRGVGEEAFWTGDARAGALYVLSDDVVLRISVGGVNDERERIRRSKALAQAALQRMHETR